MELETQRFYRRAAARTTDASIRKLLGDLAEAETEHEHIAGRLVEENVPASVRAEEERVQRRMFVLRVIQPGLAGLMDGSVSTLAPLFAAAFATGQSWNAFVVGLAASIGAGISMGFAEALSDNGSLTGRGAPLIRGVICGLMTTLGGIGHTLPYLIPALLDRDDRLRSAWWWLNSASSVGSAGSTWIRHPFPLHSRWRSAACWCLPPAS